MVDLYLLQQLVAVWEHKTLIAAAQELCVTQPALSKSMQRLEEIIGISLFNRSNRKIELNETGTYLAIKAKRYLEDGESMLAQVYAYDRALHNISFGVCSPDTILDVSPILTSLFPDLSVTTRMDSDDALLQGLDKGQYQMIVTSHELNREDLYVFPYKTVTLYISVPQEHPFYEKSEVTPEELNGQFVLIYTDIGIWRSWLKENLPGIHLLMMEDINAIREAIGLGTNLSFVTDNVIRSGYQTYNQKILPIVAPQTSISFYLLCKKENYFTYRKVFQKLAQNSSRNPNA